MAGLGRKVWAADEILAAADLQDYIQDQTVMRFANASARTSGILSPTEGMVTYLDDANALFVYDGSSWVAVVGDGSISTAKLADNAVTTAKIANNAVDVNKIADGNVTNAKLASGIDASKITTGTLPLNQVPTIPSSKLGTGNWDMGASTLTTINVTASGVVSAGNFSSGGSLTANTGITSTGVYNQTNTGRAMFVASNGVFGIGSSSERFKENIVDADIDSDAVLNVRVRNFNYKPDFSDDVSLQVGVIAEELVELGLSEFVFFDDEGNADGVAYEKLALALIPVIQKQEQRLAVLEERLGVK